MVYGGVHLCLTQTEYNAPRLYHFFCTYVFCGDVGWSCNEGGGRERESRRKEGLNRGDHVEYL